MKSQLVLLAFEMSLPTDQQQTASIRRRYEQNFELFYVRYALHLDACTADPSSPMPARLIRFLGDSKTLRIFMKLGVLESLCRSAILWYNQRSEKMTSRLWAIHYYDQLVDEALIGRVTSLYKSIKGEKKINLKLELSGKIEEIMLQSALLYLNKRVTDFSGPFDPVNPFNPLDMSESDHATIRNIIQNPYF